MRRVIPVLIAVVVVVLLGANLPLTLGQMCCSPCDVVDNIAGPPAVQSGKPFTVASFVTVSCYLLPRIRVDLLDATSYRILSSVSFLLPYSPSGVYAISLTNNATARDAPGSWALEIQAYALDEASGFSIGQWLQTFQILVLPYPPQGSTQATDTPTLASLSTSSTSTQATIPNAQQRVVTGVSTVSRRDFSRVNSLS